MTILHDGEGSGYKAGVTDEYLLKTLAKRESLIEHISRMRHKAFEFHMTHFTLTTLSTLHNLVWMKNTSSSENFHIERVRYYWSGGTTNYNRPVSFRTYYNSSTPTVNVITGQWGSSTAPHNLFVNSNIFADIDFRFWDGVGTGMTVADTGLLINCGIITQGLTENNYDGALIMAPNSILMLAANARYGEGGDLVITVVGYHREGD